MPGVTLPTPPGPEPSSVVGPKGQAPLSGRLVGGRNPALCEEILHVSETEIESVVQPNGMTDDLGREPVSSVARHPDTVPGPPSSWQNPREARLSRRDRVDGASWVKLKGTA